MKKLMLLSAIIMFSCLKLQSQIKLIDVDPIVCPGDSIWADFKWDNKSGVTNFRIDYVINASPIGAHIWSKDNSDFTKLSKKLLGLDTIYTIKLKTTFGWQTGRVEFKTQESSEVFLIEINCGILGVEELSLGITKPIYFDVTGHKCEPIKGVLLIEQIGNVIRKVIISE